MQSLVCVAQRQLYKFYDLVRGISKRQDPPEMLARENVVLERRELGLQAVGVDITEAPRFGYLVGEVLLREDAFVVFYEYGYAAAVRFGGLCGEEPVEPVFGCRED